MKKVGVIGLGYIGLPLALALSKDNELVGYDINHGRVKELQNYYDSNEETSNSELETSNMKYTTDESELSGCEILIVTVPTPVDETYVPDLTPLKQASEIIGRNIKKGGIAVYESSVYPGTTEDYCAPIIEKTSGLKYGKEFTVGYSPERINPGDKKHTIHNVLKIVSASDKKTLLVLEELYGKVTSAGVHKAKSIKAAETVKVMENTQRFVNIALVNELYSIFDKMGIKFDDVFELIKTKWNYLPFQPGLVGGHCIGVDPYYLHHAAIKHGLNPELIASSGRINNNIASHQAQKILKNIISDGANPFNLKVLIAGATFKADVNDLRNSKVEHLAHELKNYGLDIKFHDPMIESNNIFGYENISMDKALEEGFEYAILAVNHKNIKIPEKMKKMELFN